MPWDAAAPPPPPVPVSARNPVTGERVRVDVSEDLRQAIKAAINGTVMENRPALAQAAKAHPQAVAFIERTMMHGAGIDLVVASVAAIATIIWPHSWFTSAAWVVTGVLACKTLVQSGVAAVAGRSTT